jgi:diguanylate cyclase (GGDEF)-like protein/PAS domain S-box-containing protein
MAVLDRKDRDIVPDVSDFIGVLSDPDLLQLMLFACPDGVVATDPQDHIVLYTGACEEIFGFAPFEVLHRDVSVLFATDRAYSHLRDLLVRDGHVTNVELPAVRKDAIAFSAAVSAAVLRNRYGEYMGTVAYVRDHTAVRAIEDTLRSNNEQLEGLVFELDRVARHDQLTGLLNRGSAIEAAEMTLLHSGLSNRGFAVVLMDVDHFKQVNDSYGHLVGDEVLAGLGAALTATAREGDVIGRFGGEEFIAFLPGASLRDALEFAERLRVAVAQEKVLVGNEARIGVTISAGVAAIPGCADSLQDAIRVADDRLFVAKRAGRNRVIGMDERKDGRSAA